MEVSLLFGVALGVCIGVALMSFMVFRTRPGPQITTERVGDVTRGVVDPALPRRRHNKQPRDRHTAEEVQSGRNVEHSLT